MIEAAVAKATAPLQERIAALEAELAKAKKNSSNSSKPPSSDLVKPPKPPRKDGAKRQPGGQPGHEQHLRADFPPEAIDEVVPYTLDCCPDCGGKLRPFEHPAEVLQQVEIAAAPTIVTEHRASAYWCPRCQALHCAPLPETVEKAGLFGPRLTALVAFMKGVCHASFSTIRKFLRDVVGVTVSRGYLVKVIAKVSRSLTLPDREDQAYGQRLRETLRELFAVIHRREKMTAAGFQKALEAARKQVLWAGTTRVPDTKMPAT